MISVVEFSLFIPVFPGSSHIFNKHHKQSACGHFTFHMHKSSSSGAADSTFKLSFKHTHTHTEAGGEQKTTGPEG